MAVAPRDVVERWQREQQRGQQQGTPDAPATPQGMTSGDGFASAPGSVAPAGVNLGMLFGSGQPLTTPIDRRAASFMGNSESGQGLPASAMPQAAPTPAPIDATVSAVAAAVQRRLEDLFASTRGRFGF